MNEYLIDLVEQDGECYVPLQTMNDLFMAPQYLYVIYNGKALYCVPYQSDLMEEVYEAGPAGEMSFESGTPPSSPLIPSCAATTSRPITIWTSPLRRSS